MEAELQNHGRRLTPLLLVAVVLSLALPLAAAPEISVYVNGQRLNQSPVSVKGSTLVPLRGIFEALGASVVWDGPARTVRAQKDSTSVELVLDSPYALVNSQPKRLDVPATVIGGLTMVPLRFIGEALGAEVKWEGATRTVLITSAEALAAAGQDTPQPPAAVAPKINQVVVSPQRALVPGDTLTVIMTGDTGGQASFDIVAVRTGVPMPEVGPGRYQGNLVIPAGLQADAAALLVKLTKAGQEAMQQAATGVTIRSTSTTDTSSVGIEFPTANSTVSSLRPEIGVSFPTAITAGSVRMSVDNMDVTSAAQVYGTRISWQPPTDLGIGQHSARVTGVDNFGNNLNRQWSFGVSTVGSNATGLVTSLSLSPTSPYTVGQNVTVTLRGLAGGTATYDVAGRTGFILRETAAGVYQGTYTVSNQDVSGTRMEATLKMPDGRTEIYRSSEVVTIGQAAPAVTLSVTSPQANQKVDGTFTIVGTATPNATVRVTARAQQSLIPGIISITGRTFTASAVAAVDGQFTVNLAASEASAGSTLDLTILAEDSTGRTSTPVQFQVVRQ